MLVQLGDVNSSSSYKVLHSLGRRYTMLPVFSTSKEASKEDDGERLFDIDANTRKISIPQDFVSNGVSVGLYGNCSRPYHCGFPVSWDSSCHLYLAV